MNGVGNVLILRMRDMVFILHIIQVDRYKVDSCGYSDRGECVIL